VRIAQEGDALNATETGPRNFTVDFDGFLGSGFSAPGWCDRSSVRDDRVAVCDDSEPTVERVTTALIPDDACRVPIGARNFRPRRRR
jgi:hypothetical protein